MVTDLLVREYETYTEEQIVGEVTDIYGEEFAQDFVRISNCGSNFRLK
jgi:hypothetical protein